MAHPGAKRSMIAKESNTTYHTHVDEQGFAHRCYHVSRSLFRSYEFWLGMVIGNLIIGTIQFPIEHWVWENVPGLSNITQWMGL